MSSRGSRPHAARAALLAAALTPALAIGAGEATGNGADGPPPDPRTFAVSIDDRDVGTHRFTFENQAGGFAVRSEADFELRLAFLTAFRYRHEADERWRGGCLERLSSSTEQSGSFVENRNWSVSAEQTSNGFSIETQDGGQTVDLACPWSFAYWNPALREHDTLVNSQDGRVFDVTWEARGASPLSMGERSVATDAWSLTDGDKLDITLYYDDEDRWIGLDSRIKGGRVLRYRAAPSDPYYPG